MVADHATIPAVRKGEERRVSRDRTVRALLVGGPMYDGLQVVEAAGQLTETR
jgi:hypothetical protein